ncbi:MAG: efflux transporter outer membrane subunit [Nitrospirota bacterium]|nr:efflux transporter outer membrane subunit [Nitrospirota bacterium]
MKGLARLLSAGLCAACLSACAVGPTYKKPETKVPDQWTTAQKQAEAAKAEELARWWTTFDDPVLDGLVARAVKSNLDLRLAEARIREARAARGITDADRWPSIDASASQTRSRTSEKQPRSANRGGTGKEYDIYQAGFDASWEIDLFGAVKRAVEAADADIETRMEARRAVLVALLGDVARNYIEVRGLQKEIAITRENIRLQQETLELVRARYTAGLNSYLDVTRAEQLVANTTSQLPTQEITLKQTIHRLGVLLGQEPGALMAELEEAKPIPATTNSVPVGLPSELLLRRPDIRQAERELAAATARTGVATADLFPRFSLTGSFGLQGGEARDLGFSSSRFWSVGPTVRWPVFDAGRIRANIKVQNERQEQALTLYEQTVLRALEDVENSLVAWQREQARRESLTQAVDAGRQSLAMSSELFTKGLINFLDVIEVEKSLVEAESQLARSESAVSSNLVALYKALGGGWEVKDDQKN